MSDIVSWPWPRIIVSDYKTFLVSGVAGGNLTLSELFYSSTGYWGAFPVLNLGAYADVNELSIADFGPFYIVCTFGRDAYSTPVRRMYVRDLTVALGYAYESFITTTTPVCGVGLNFKGQFVGANASNGDLTARHVLWSDIGNFELNLEDSSEAGYIPTTGAWPTNQNVHVYKLMQLGDTVIAYSDAGPVILEPKAVAKSFAYSHTRLPGLGVLSGNHVAGDVHMHGLIDTNGEFWEFSTTDKLVRRGYKEFIRPILDYSGDSDSRTIVSYRPTEQHFYISNGVTCLVINRYGAYTTHQQVSSVVQPTSGVLIGTSLDTTDTEARITSDKLDFGSRGIKSVESLLMNCVQSTGSSSWLSVDWRVGNSLAYQSRPWIRSGPIGRAGIHTAGLDFRLRARFSSYLDVELIELLTNVKFSDQRFKRGTVPRQYEVGSA